MALDGASDHGVSEALYLRDPDGNGVELYWDRPQEEWPRGKDGGARDGDSAAGFEGVVGGGVTVMSLAGVLSKVMVKLLMLACPSG